ncbi:MAG: glycosyltransferase family 2 protein [Elusimicrobia bacterium]|nr:glycosyltransferase family 2 protein [Elusimicrobiota bacterium]
MTISVVIPTRDRPVELRRLLAALAAQTRPPDEVVVVDSGSTPIPERTAALPINVLRTTPHVCVQRNAGIRASSGELIFLIDDDVVPEPDFIAVMARTFDLHPEYAGGMGTLPPSMRRFSAGALLCRLFMLQHEYGDGGYYLSGHPRHPYGIGTFRETRVLGGGLMAVRRAALMSMPELFDESMEHSQEDSEFSLRLSERHRLFFNPLARVAHTASPIGRPPALERARRTLAAYRYIYAKNIFPARPWTLPFHWWAVVGMFVVGTLTGPAGTARGYWRGLNTG